MFQPGTLQKKLADDFIIEFSSKLAALKENFTTSTERVYDLSENCSRIEDRIVKLARVYAEMGQQIVSMGERMNEINQRKTELEQERIHPPSQDLSFAKIVRTTSSAPKVVYTPSSPSPTEHIETLEYATSETERERKLLKVKVIHPGISTSSPYLDLHAKKFFYEQLNMPNREVDDQMYVAKMSQPYTVMISYLITDLKCFRSQLKKSCASIKRCNVLNFTTNATIT